MMLASKLKCVWIAVFCIFISIPCASATETKLIPEHEQIEGPFEDGMDVTDTCLECHEQQARDLMKTSHWTWSNRQNVINKGWTDTGKRHAINNFCIGVASNLSSCTQCHAGYGWKDDSFDFDDASAVDCLVCHDTTGEYKRIAGVGGQADLSIDLSHIAQNVGSPGRHNCGMCHFYGGGGHGVKHGDLEASLIKADASLDIHMAEEGLNFPCQHCHATSKHRIPGNSMTVTPAGDSHVRCTNCHEETLHEKRVLNHHAKTIACQTCHIPSFARIEPTKTYWDWSTAEKGKQKKYDPRGLPQYLPYKGDFVWGKNIKPEYEWFNGTAGVYTWGDKLDPKKVIKLNWPVGDKADPQARIYPFKIHKARQVYDRENNYLINPYLAGEKGFWKQVDWDSAATIGMQARGLPYSGQYGFVDTMMYWRINHTVESADKALECKDCHGRDQTRMDWKKLGYSGDPLFLPGQARHQIKK